jgi:hypothetical protein
MLFLGGFRLLFLLPLLGFAGLLMLLLGGFRRLLWLPLLRVPLLWVPLLRVPLLWLSLLRVPLWRFAWLLFLLLVLCVGRSNSSEEQAQDPCADSECHWHIVSPSDTLAEMSLLTWKNA